MVVKKRSLGRGLDALLSCSSTDARMPQLSSDRRRASCRAFAVEHLQRGQYQPRQDFGQEALEELARSISRPGRGAADRHAAAHRARPRAGRQRYEIIAGERRWRAAQLAGLQKIPAVVRDIPDSAAMAMALIENIQREDLNPLEEAVALHRLVANST
jgi:ParB family transcriptional regulator, chromosome partitioning protein